MKHEIALAEGDADRRTQQIRELRELIVALDCRVPRIERAGETQIARDAQHLRGLALERIAALEA